MHSRLVGPAVTVEPSQEVLRSAASVFPDRTPRWRNNNCKAGRIPGAIKIGRTWMITSAGLAALASTADDGSAQPPTVEQALAELRARGSLQ